MAAFVAAHLLALSAVATQAATVRVDVPKTTLDRALTSLAAQTGAEIVSAEPGLAAIAVRGVHGAMPLEAALARLLAGSGFHAVAVGPDSYRIVRVTKLAPARPPHPRPPEAESPEVVVTASKQAVSRLRFPGSVVVGLLPTGGKSDAEPDLDDVARAAPILQNTELGKGRNKIFIRGIADSSFNGAAQSTTSIYFGDVPLGFSGSEPALALHDVDRIEIMEGPQGALYGAGAIGGVLRITPVRPDLTQFAASLSGGLTATQSGNLGYDFSGVANLPLTTNVAGLRLVGYTERSGGYIDDARRRLSNINGSTLSGGRAALRIDPGAGWQIDLSALAQSIDTDDGQYVESGADALERRSATAQPFSSTIVLGRAVVRKTWDNGVELTSATGLVIRHSDDTFDATGLIGPAVKANYDDLRNGRLFTQETRLSQSLSGGGSWLAGFTLIDDSNRQSRTFGPLETPIDIIGVSNMITSRSIFGEATLPLTQRFRATAGLRITRARTDGEPSAKPRAGSFIRGRSTTRADPTLAFSWLLAPRLAAFGRFQTGYRTGGLAVARGVGRVADFRSDSIRMGEAGLRLERGGATGVALSTAVSYARWTNIQADLLNRRGEPYTANIGDAEIVSFEAAGDWVPLAGLKVSASMLYTQNRVDGPVAQLSVRANRRLPETPPFAANGSIAYRWAAGGDGELRAVATISYVGRSVLGTGDLLDISQGRYAVAGVSAGWRRGPLDLSLTVDNLTNAHSNRFSFGNPFTFAQRTEMTPLQPLNARLGASISW